MPHSPVLGNPALSSREDITTRRSVTSMRHRAFNREAFVAGALVKGMEFARKWCEASCPDAQTEVPAFISGGRRGLACALAGRLEKF